jgi:hypothetical protein
MLIIYPDAEAMQSNAAAMGWARRIPLPGRGSIEVRQVM